MVRPVSWVKLVASFHVSPSSLLAFLGEQPVVARRCGSSEPSSVDLHPQSRSSVVCAHRRHTPCSIVKVIKFRKLVAPWKSPRPCRMCGFSVVPSMRCRNRPRLCSVASAHQVRRVESFRDVEHGDEWPLSCRSAEHNGFVDRLYSRRSPNCSACIHDSACFSTTAVRVVQYNILRFVTTVGIKSHGAVLVL